MHDERGRFPLQYRDAGHIARFRRPPQTDSARTRRHVPGSGQGSLADIFRWIPYCTQTRADFHSLVEKVFDEQELGESVAFAPVERSSSQVIGSTRFMNIDRVNRRTEIGSSWIAPAWQGTAVNPEGKYRICGTPPRNGNASASN
jgi:RimJ/RimL family protein N-acetyltransferase